MSQPRTGPAPRRAGRLRLTLGLLVAAAALPLALLTGAAPAHAAACDVTGHQPRSRPGRR